MSGWWSIFNVILFSLFHELAQAYKLINFVKTAALTASPISSPQRIHLFQRCGGWGLPASDDDRVLLPLHPAAPDVARAPPRRDLRVKLQPRLHQLRTSAALERKIQTLGPLITAQRALGQILHPRPCRQIHGRQTRLEFDTETQPIKMTEA